jgi:hypothetical protein
MSPPIEHREKRPLELVSARQFNLFRQAQESKTSLFGDLKKSSTI